MGKELIKWGALFALVGFLVWLVFSMANNYHAIDRYDVAMANALDFTKTFGVEAKVVCSTRVWWSSDGPYVNCAYAEHGSSTWLECSIEPAGACRIQDHLQMDH